MGPKPEMGFQKWGEDALCVQLIGYPLSTTIVSYQCTSNSVLLMLVNSVLSMHTNYPNQWGYLGPFIIAPTTQVWTTHTQRIRVSKYSSDYTHITQIWVTHTQQVRVFKYSSD